MYTFRATNAPTMQTAATDRTETIGALLLFELLLLWSPGLKLSAAAAVTLLLFTSKACKSSLVSPIDTTDVGTTVGMVEILGIAVGASVSPKGGRVGKSDRDGDGLPVGGVVEKAKEGVMECPVGWSAKVLTGEFGGEVDGEFGGELICKFVGMCMGVLKE